jgi:hypothetical protein
MKRRQHTGCAACKGEEAQLADYQSRVASLACSVLKPNRDERIGMTIVTEL